MATLSYGSDVVQPIECFSTLIDRHDGPASCFTDLEEYQAVWSLTKFTTSKPLDEDLWKKVHLAKSSLKAHVRAGVTPRVRRNYWLAILEVKDEDVISYSHAIGQPEQNPSSPVVAPPQIPDGVPSFSQGSNFSTAYERLMGCVMDCFSSVPNNSFLPVLAHVLLHLLEEWECYVVIKKIIQRQGWLDRTVVEQTASIMTLKNLITSHLRDINLSLLKPVGMGADLFETEFLSLWCYWPFLNQPFWIVVRIMDLYLLEGPKIFYRLALVAVKMIHSSSLVETYRSCNINGDLTINQILVHFLSTLSLEQRGQWIHEALAIPRLSWKSIFKLWLQNCAIAQQNSTPPATLVPTGIRESSNKKKIYLLDSSSEILSPTLSEILVNWLPDWAIGDYLECIFKTSKHGYNLRTLYHKCEHEDAFILVIKSSEAAIFGAFVVGNLTERHNNTFFGSGETFLFTLKPHPSHYQWTAKSDLVLRANDEELIIGSGGGQFGIWVDGDLDRGSSASCTAYDNSPLTGTTAVDFKCSAIEVFKISWVQ